MTLFKITYLGGGVSGIPLISLGSPSRLLRILGRLGELETNLSSRGVVTKWLVPCPCGCSGCWVGCCWGCGGCWTGWAGRLTSLACWLGTEINNNMVSLLPFYWLLFYNKTEKTFQSKPPDKKRLIFKSSKKDATFIKRQKYFFCNFGLV